LGTTEEYRIKCCTEPQGCRTVSNLGRMLIEKTRGGDIPVSEESVAT